MIQPLEKTFFIFFAFCSLVFHGLWGAEGGLSSSDQNGTILYFVRHGETDWNKEHKIQGHNQVSLNSKGIDQAKSLAERLISYHFCKSRRECYPLRSR